MIVRAARVDDSRGIADVQVAAWRVAYRGILPNEVLDGLSVDDREERWREILDRSEEGSFTLVAVGEESVAGFCSAVAPSHHAGEGVAEIAATYVDPARWRTGCGSRLLEAVLARLAERDWHEVVLWVFARNAPARAFYERHGFEPDGAEQAHQWAGGAIAVRMRLAAPDRQ